MWDGGVAIANIEFGSGIIEKVTSESKCCVYSWGKNIVVGRNRECKSPKVGVCLEGSRSSSEARTR